MSSSPTTSPTTSVPTSMPTSVLSRKALLALEAVVDVALHARPNPVQARDITARQGVPQRYLEQVMQSLVRANILRGVRGPHGGYRLARERRRISVLEIVQVIQADSTYKKGGTYKGRNYKEEQPAYSAYSALGKQIIAPFHNRLCQSMVREIGDTTIDDLCATLDNGADNKTENKPDANPDFNI